MFKRKRLIFALTNDFKLVLAPDLGITNERTANDIILALSEN